MRPESTSKAAAESAGAPSSSAAAAAAAASSSSSPSPSGKRSRDPEDEVYLDNFHSHKRYLSEIMASSLNGLTVGDALPHPPPDNLMESPARDDMSLQYSPMSEDSDDSRFCDNPINTCSSQPDSAPSSPVSPHRHQRPLAGFPSTCSPTSHACTVTNFNCSQPRQRGSDSEGRFPSSPSDICHSADLRRAALLRSVQMRTQPVGPPSFELAFGSGQESVSNIDAEAEERSCSYMKSLVDEREYPIVDCSSMSISESDFKQEKSCRMLDMDLKEKHSAD